MTTSETVRWIQARAAWNRQHGFLEAARQLEALAQALQADHSRKKAS